MAEHLEQRLMSPQPLLSVFRKQEPRGAWEGAPDVNPGHRFEVGLWGHFSAKSSSGSLRIVGKVPFSAGQFQLW